jgi:hypothetical protein
VRSAYAAAHVVGEGSAIDWSATLGFRRYLWSLGLGVAEAMDTAQRGGALGWDLARELIERSLREARECGGALVCGINTDQLPRDGDGSTLQLIEAAYLEQLEFVESRGGRAAVMASRALCRAARSAEDYERVYGAILARVKRPAILHWLGPMFDAQLTGYWGSVDRAIARETVLRIVSAHALQVDGIKISLLDAPFEVAFRREVPAGVHVYTGDDFNFPELIAGDERGHSEALLGVFSAIAPLASRALRALEAGDRAEYDALLAPAVPLARKIFEAPTQAYKAGVAFLSYLNGHQPQFRMLGGFERSRSPEHLREVFELALAAGAIDDPEAARRRYEALYEPARRA